MLGHIRSELIKLASTRTFIAFLVGSMMIVGVATWSTFQNLGAANVDGPLHHQQFFFISAVNLAVFSAVLGVRSVTDEFRYGTISLSLLSHGRRAWFLIAKAGVVGTAASVLAALSLLGMLVISMALRTTGSTLVFSDESRLAVLGLMLGTAVWAAIGVAVGAIIRHQVAAVVAVILWLLVAENLGSGLLGEAGRYLPAQAGQALAFMPGAVPAPTGAAVLLAYLLAVLILAGVSIGRRDL